MKNLFIYEKREFMGELDRKNNSETNSVSPQTGNRVFTLAKNISPNVSSQELVAELEKILIEIMKTHPSEMPLVYESINSLRQQPVVIDGLITLYHTVKKEDFNKRLLVLSLIGELRLEKSFPFFKQIVWRPLPFEKNLNRTEAGFSQRDYEEMLTAKAVHGIGYLCNNESFNELEKIMTSHESKHVRIAAINTYMWNKKDDNMEAAHLYKILPMTFHPYVERPRFSCHVDPTQFDVQMSRWLSKWKTSGKQANSDKTGGR
jgi:hypothetical protein